MQQHWEDTHPSKGGRSSSNPDLLSHSVGDLDAANIPAQAEGFRSRSRSGSRYGKATDPGTERHDTGCAEDSLSPVRAGGGFGAVGVQPSHRVLPRGGSHMGPGSEASSVRGSLVGGFGRSATSFVNGLFRMGGGHTQAATPYDQQGAAFGTPLSC